MPHMIRIGPYQLNGKAVLAPMAGVTDYPFRQMCRQAGAAMVTAEMTASNPALRNTLKSRLRTANRNDTEPRAVQIVGTEPEQMADAAEYQVQAGAQIVDINMGCPAKKVCKKLAGSALLKDEKLVARILQAVVARVDVPVTLKIRTGWDHNSKNAVQIARIAEQCGIQSLAVHGRTRACKYQGVAEYDTIAEVASHTSIPVFANGDIHSAQKAIDVLEYTGADGVMIGRGAQGRPWIFSEINSLIDTSEVSCALFTSKSLNSNDAKRLERLIIKHLQLIYTYYSDSTDEKLAAPSLGNKIADNFLFNLAIKVARKHVCWYFEQLKHVVAGQEQDSGIREQGGHSSLNDEVLKTGASNNIQAVRVKIEAARKQFNQLESQSAQLDYLQQFFGELRTIGDIAA